VKENKKGEWHIETLLRLTESQGPNWIDAQQDATPKNKNIIICMFLLLFSVRG
jgi:hypothetical protein